MNIWERQYDLMENRERKLVSNLEELAAIKGQPIVQASEPDRVRCENLYKHMMAQLEDVRAKKLQAALMMESKDGSQMDAPSKRGPKTKKVKHVPVSEAECKNTRRKLVIIR